MAGKPRVNTHTAELWIVEFIVTHNLKPTYDRTRQLKYFHDNRAVESFDPKKRREGGGRKPLMSDKESELNAALRIKDSGSGIATRAVNVKRTLEANHLFRSPLWGATFILASKGRCIINSR